MNSEELRQEVDNIQWFHRYEIAPGIMTNGVSDMNKRGPYFDIPADLTGKRVLDVGCNDGYFTFLAESRGAEVVAIDNWPRRGFFLAHKARQSRVEFHHMNIYDVTPDTFGMFDIVFFFGVLYHLKHPLLALERVAAVTREYALVESEIIPLPVYGRDFRGTAARLAKRLAPNETPPGIGLFYFYDKDGLGGDPTNWFVPDETALVSSVIGAGFPRAEFVTRYDMRRGIVRAHKGPRTAGKILNEDFFVNIDVPKSGATVSGIVKTNGFALSQMEPQGGIKRVLLYIDELDNPDYLLGEAVYPLPRPDLTRPFVDDYGHCGFEFEWNTVDISPGPHTLFAFAEGTGGWHYRAISIVVT